VIPVDPQPAAPETAKAPIPHLGVGQCRRSSDISKLDPSPLVVSLDDGKVEVVGVPVCHEVLNRCVATP